jgi:uncharacterized protein YkwD
MGGAKARGSLALLALAAACIACAAPVWAAPGDLAPGVDASPTAPLAIQRDTTLESAVLAEINRTRERAGLHRLRLSKPLAKAAAFHSREMADYGYFDHRSANGISFWNRIGRYYPRKRGRYWAVGENMLWSTTIDPAGFVNSWLESPSHGGNVLSPRWREVGLGALMVPIGPGVFGGLSVVILTADFGTKR